MHKLNGPITSDACDENLRHLARSRRGRSPTRLRCVVPQCRWWRTAGRTDTWSLGSSGNWKRRPTGRPAWCPNNGTPTGSTYNVDIVDGVSTVSLNTNATINDLSLASGNTLNINNGQQLTIDGPTIANSGAIQINGGGGGNGYLAHRWQHDLKRRGTITLSTVTTGGGNAFLQETGSGVTLTNSGSTIQGNGVIGNGTGLAIVNSTGGTINANVNGDNLVVNNTGGITNTGLLEATNGGSLAFGSVAITNTGGNITASGTGSVVVLTNTSVTGGTLNTSGGGVIESSATTGLNGVTISSGSTFTSSNHSTTQVSGTITNNGGIQVFGGGGANGIVELTANTTLSGGGTLTLSTTQTGGGNAYIDPASSGLILTNSNNTVQGDGIIGNGALVVVNDSTIDSNVAGAQLLFNGGAVTNTGLIEATGGGILQFSGIAIANGGGNLTATVRAA